MDKFGVLAGHHRELCMSILEEIHHLETKSYKKDQNRQGLCYLVGDSLEYMESHE